MIFWISSQKSVLNVGTNKNNTLEFSRVFLFICPAGRGCTFLRKSCSQVSICLPASVCWFSSSVCVVSVSSVAIAMMFLSAVLHFVFSHGSSTSAASCLTFFIVLITDIAGNAQNNNENDQ